MGQYDLTDEQLMLQDMVRKIAIIDIKPIAGQFERDEKYPPELKELFKKQGIFAIPYPEEYGGTGGGLFDMCIVVEELSKVDASSGMVALNHELAATPILIAGTEVQKKKYISQVASGDTYMAFGLTEPDAGSDVASMRTKAVDMGDYYLVNGAKRYISFAEDSGVMTLFAKTDTSKGAKGISAFIVELDWPGITVGRHEDKMGFRAIQANEVYFDDVKIPKENLLGKEGSGFKTAMLTLNATRPLIGSVGVGLSQGALDDAIEYAKQRIQFGKPISENQGLQWMMADMAMKIEAARQLVYKAACLADNDDPNAAKFGAMAKCYATDIAMSVAVDAVQICGGAGYMKEYPFERRMRDAKLLQIVEGTNQIQRIVISSYLLA